METTFIYGLYDPRTNELRYVGKANNPSYRLSCHIREVKWKSRVRNSHKNNWIKSLLRDGIRPVVKVIEEVPVNQWKEHEIRIIAEAKEQGYRLVNSTIGGEGVKGHQFTEEHKRNMSISRKGRSGWNKGIPMPDEVKEKIRKANTGHRHTDESKKKMSQRISEAKKGKSWTDNQRKLWEEREKQPISD